MLNFQSSVYLLHDKSLICTAVLCGTVRQWFNAVGNRKGVLPLQFRSVYFLGLACVFCDTSALNVCCMDWPVCSVIPVHWVSAAWTGLCVLWYQCTERLLRGLTCVFCDTTCSALNVCCVELLLKIGTLLMEMLSYEKTLDNFIDLLRKDEVSQYPLMIS